MDYQEAKAHISSKNAELVSVIIPVFNREVLVKEAIQSVYEQSYRPIECILVDDGSTDNTVPVVNELKTALESNDFAIHILIQENTGAPAARNRGLKRASGEFIQFLDSDDLLYPRKLEQHVAYLKANGDVDGVYGDWHHGTIEKHKLIKGEKWENTLSQFYGGRVIHTLSMMLRRALVEKIGLWDEGLKRNQEVDFFMRAVLSGGNFEYLPQLTGLWREHEGERIVSTHGILSALAFHDKWYIEFQKLNLFSNTIKKRMAHYYFWYAMELDASSEKQALHYLKKACKLYADFPEFNTTKMKLLRALFGKNKSITMWYRKACKLKKKA